MLLQYISLIVLVTVSLAKKPADFCDPKWCPAQGKHIACNNTGGFGPDCEGTYRTENLDAHHKLILKLHNEARNKIALGTVPGFGPAVRMPVLKWDRKMAVLAELNVKTCHFEHDECRSTSEYPYCGQNIYYAKTTQNNNTIVDFIKDAVQMWFIEHMDADMELIKKYKVTVPQTGHFTAMMTDRIDRVGCGYLHSTIPRKKKKPLSKIIFTCNYPSTNIEALPTYKSGQPASMCKKVHYVYKGLCAENEYIDPNDFSWYFD